MTSALFQTASCRQRSRFKFALWLAIALLAADFCVATDTVSFEGWPAMNNALTLVPTDARLSNQLATVSGVVFRSVGGSAHVAVVRLGLGHASSGTNGIGGVNAAGVLNYATPISVDFVMPQNPAVPAVVDFVSVRCDSNSIAGTVTLEAFDESGILLGTTTRNDAPGLALGITHSGIRSVRISESSGTVAFDDLTFSAPTPAAQPRLNIHPAGAQVDVCWQSRTTHSYQLQFASSLIQGGWTNLGAPVPGNGTTNCVSVVPDQPQRVYRLLLLP
jgi:hypothetical protein